MTPMEWNRIRVDWELRHMSFSGIATSTTYREQDRIHVQRLQERRVELLVELKSLDGALYRSSGLANSNELTAHHRLNERIGRLKRGFPLPSRVCVCVRARGTGTSQALRCV